MATRRKLSKGADSPRTGATFAGTAGPPNPAPAPEVKPAYVAKDYAKLLGMPGFSETLLKNHFTLYQGYVTNTNKVLDALAALLKDGKTGAPEFGELKRRLGWEFDGMRLHEYYFSNLKKGGSSVDRASNFLAKIRESFSLRRMRPIGKDSSERAILRPMSRMGSTIISCVAGKKRSIRKAPARRWQLIIY